MYNISRPDYSHIHVYFSLTSPEDSKEIEVFFLLLQKTLCLDSPIFNQCGDARFPEGNLPLSLFWGDKAQMREAGAGNGDTDWPSHRKKVLVFLNLGRATYLDWWGARKEATSYSMC